MIVYSVVELVAIFKCQNRCVDCLNWLKSLKLGITSGINSTLAACGLFFSYVLPVALVIYFAARQKLSCDLSKNFEVTQYCGECFNVFDNGIHDFECFPKNGEEFFMTVLMDTKDLIIESGLTVLEFASPKKSCWNSEHCKTEMTGHYLLYHLK